MKTIYTYTYSINGVIGEKLNGNQIINFTKTKNGEIIEKETMYGDEAHGFALFNKMIDDKDIIINNKISSSEEIEEIEYKNKFYITIGKKGFTLVDKNGKSYNQKLSKYTIEKIITNNELDNTYIAINEYSSKLTNEEILNLVK